MAIHVTATTKPTVEYNQVHLVSLDIRQPYRDDASVTPKFRVMIVYQLFGVDDQNKMHYHPDQVEIEIEDFLAKATAEYVAGDPTLIGAFKAIETAIASLIRSDRGISARVV